MIDCSSSDLPEPVVPATSACGPSFFMSTTNVPVAHSPIGAAVVRPLARHSSAIRSGAGGSRSSTSSSRSAVGSALSSSSRLTSRTAVIARATRSHQATLTWSASTPVTRSPNARRTVIVACSPGA